MRFITLRSPVKNSVKYFKWLLKVVKGFAKGWQRTYFVFRPDHKGHIGSLKRDPVRTLLHSLLPRPHLSRGNRSGEPNRISWAYYQNVVRTNEIALLSIIM